MEGLGALSIDSGFRALVPKTILCKDFWFGVWGLGFRVEPSKGLSVVSSNIRGASATVYDELVQTRPAGYST